MKCNLKGAIYREYERQAKEREANDKRTPEQKEKDRQKALELLSFTAAISASLGDNPYSKI